MPVPATPPPLLQPERKRERMRGSTFPAAAEKLAVVSSSSSSSAERALWNAFGSLCSGSVLAGCHATDTRFGSASASNDVAAVCGRSDAQGQ